MEGDRGLLLVLPGPEYFYPRPHMEGDHTLY